MPYSNAAASARHDVRRIEVAQLAFPLLRTQADFETGALPPELVQPSEDLRWAQHWVFLFPLWHGTMPALFKGFLEQVFRPGFAMEYNPKGLPKRLLAGRSARIVVTMGMPALMYRWYFGAYGVRGFERSMLSFAGIKPIRESLYGLTFADVACALARGHAPIRQTRRLRERITLQGVGSAQRNASATMEHDVCADLCLDCAAVVDPCGATIGIARKITTFGDALVIHTVATPVLSYVDQGRRKRSPRHRPLRKVKNRS
jgi:putative NADPH-quinone reductase